MEWQKELPGSRPTLADSQRHWTGHGNNSVRNNSFSSEWELWKSSLPWIACAGPEDIDLHWESWTQCPIQNTCGEYKENRCVCVCLMTGPLWARVMSISAKSACLQRIITLLGGTLSSSSVCVCVCVCLCVCVCVCVWATLLRSVIKDLELSSWYTEPHFISLIKLV